VFYRQSSQVAMKVESHKVLVHNDCVDGQLGVGGLVLFLHHTSGDGLINWELAKLTGKYLSS